MLQTHEGNSSSALSTQEHLDRADALAGRYLPSNARSADGLQEVRDKTKYTEETEGRSGEMIAGAGKQGLFTQAVNHVAKM